MCHRAEDLQRSKRPQTSLEGFREPYIHLHGSRRLAAACLRQIMLSLLPILLALAATAPLPASAQERPSSEGCSIVFSQGRNHSESDPSVNSMWNRVNDSFNQFVVEELRSRGERVIAMPHPVEARDMQANVNRVMRRAVSEGCGFIVDLSMFADQGSSQFVSRMRVLPLAATHSSGVGTTYSLGGEVFATDRRDALTRETLDRLAPSDVAKEFVRAYLAKQSGRGDAK